LRRGNGGIAKQALQWTVYGQRGKGHPQNTWNWKGDLKKETEAIGFNYNRRKIETAAQRTVVCGLRFAGSD